MRVLIMTDMEGIGGVDRMEQLFDKTEYHAACSLLMRDVNAAVEGALIGGADEVFVWDGHKGGKNFIDGLLHKRAVQTWDLNIVSQMKFDAALSIGAHAMVGTQNAFCEHTQSSVRIYNYLINGEKHGETAQFAGFIGAFGIPLVMVSGDGAACEQARRLLGNIAIAKVKTATGRNTAVSLSETEIIETIKTAAAQGIGMTNQIKCLMFPLPMEQEQQFTSVLHCDEYMLKARRDPRIVRIDARTVRRTVDKIEKYSDMII